MKDTTENNKKIAKNAGFLYFRMFLVLGVTLYTSRVVLQTLGIEDFGIYNVVGGVVSLFSFLNASMSGATARFVAFDLGKKDYAHLQKTFSTAMLIHILIAFIVLLLAETIGLWFLNTQLEIPQDRFAAASIVYQFSILSAMITIIQVPYNATIIANEKMDIYAYVEIVHTVLKLVIVWLLLLSPSDKLITYGALYLGVNLLVFLTYRTYGRYAFKSTCKFHFVFEKKILKKMLSFSGWDLYGNASTLARTQGVNMLLNIFFGAVLNAASGIATQVQGAVMSFAGNLVSAFRPQIVKSYAQKDYERMIALINNASIYTSMLLLLFTIPLLIETDFILTIWLGEWPEYAAILCRYILIFNLFANLSVIVVTGLHATGNIKRPSLINGSLYLSVIPVAYVGYTIGLSAEFAFLYNVIAVFIGMMCNVYALHLYIPSFQCKTYFVQVLSKCTVIGIFLYSILSGFSYFMETGWLRLLVVVAVNTLLLLFIVFFFLFGDKERSLVLSKLHIK